MAFTFVITVTYLLSGHVQQMELPRPMTQETCEIIKSMETAWWNVIKTSGISIETKCLPKGRDI